MSLPEKPSGEMQGVMLDLGWNKIYMGRLVRGDEVIAKLPLNAVLSRPLLKALVDEYDVTGETLDFTSPFDMNRWYLQVIEGKKEAEAA